MACKNCGSKKTIKAHLIPRSFCIQIQEGKSHIAGTVGPDSGKNSQSGIWDREILCKNCDGILGRWEEYALEFTRRVREMSFDSPYSLGALDTSDTTKVLRFCAGILYKYALTSPKNGRINIEPRHLEDLRAFCMSESIKPPKALNAHIFRPIRFPNDHGMFAYRAPCPDTKYGLDGFRMMMGGVIFSIILDSKSISTHPGKRQLIKYRDIATPVVCVNALEFEEYIQPQAWVESGWLSDALDRIATTANRK